MTITYDFFEYICETFRGDGFSLFIQDKEDGIILTVIIPQYPFHQVSRFFPFSCRPSEAALIYWDLSNSIRRKERYASERVA